MSDETTLLPCPFCGGESFVRIDVSLRTTQSRYRVGCDKDPSCHGWYGHSRYYATEAEAIAAWNTREPVEYDGWFYLPKPKERIVEYGAPRIEKIKDGYKMRQVVDIVDTAIRSWCDELGEHVMKRICEVWNTRAAYGTLTAEQVREAIERHGTALLGCRWQFTDKNLQAIAAELNAELGSGECEKTCYCVLEDEHDVCSECGEPWEYVQSFCPNCGARVRKE